MGVGDTDARRGTMGIGEVELWDQGGRKRIADELKGDLVGTEINLFPRAKVPENLKTDTFYIVSSKTTRWTVEFVSLTRDGLKMRIKGKPQGQPI
jgi:hypothetical protein